MFFSASIVIGLGFIVGTLLLIIPGIILGLACTVALPAAAIERRGPMAAIRRSIRLTRRRLWAILGYGLAVVIPLAVVAFALELSFVDWDVRQLDRDPFVNTVLKPFVDTVIAATNAALTAAFYFELVRLEGESNLAVGDEEPLQKPG